LFTEKDAKLNEIFPPEKQNAGVQKEGISSDGDTKLYAPPPGETGNPQKIVTPLGNADVAVFLLLSFCAAGYYYVKRHNNK
ncbi:MAG: hypothetical protein FWF54_00190, partial [Candidatus Azobacteroides sp.]|nr:hypothetical protein [Candidatus Azobacteroides sp.]